MEMGSRSEKQRRCIKRREVKRVWRRGVRKKREEQESRLERKEEQTIPRIPSTSLAERERREEGLQ